MGAQLPEKKPASLVWGEIRAGLLALARTDKPRALAVLDEALGVYRVTNKTPPARWNQLRAEVQAVEEADNA